MEFFLPYKKIQKKNNNKTRDTNWTDEHNKRKGNKQFVYFVEAYVCVKSILKLRDWNLIKCIQFVFFSLWTKRNTQKRRWWEKTKKQKKQRTFIQKKNKFKIKC